MSLSQSHLYSLTKLSKWLDFKGSFIRQNRHRLAYLHLWLSRLIDFGSHISQQIRLTQNHGICFGDRLNNMGVKLFLQNMFHYIHSGTGPFIFLIKKHLKFEFYLFFRHSLIAFGQRIRWVFLEFFIEFFDNFSLSEILVFRIVIQLSILPFC